MPIILHHYSAGPLNSTGLYEYEREDWKLCCTYLSAIYEELAVAETNLMKLLNIQKTNGLRDDIVRLERIVDAVEDDVNKVEDNVRNKSI